MQPQDIIKMIDEFCDKHSSLGISPGYDFTHIVLGDYNLSDKNIEFCLDKERIAKWINEKAKDASCIPGECDWWMLASYSEIIDYAFAACAFLYTLSEISESEREDAMNWYNRDIISKMENQNA